MKTALVTGAAHRIGQGLATYLLDNDYHVILCAHHSMKELKEWSMAHAKSSHVISLIKADLSTKEGQEYLCNEVKKKISSLDLLVNNASLFYSKKFEKISRQEYQDMMAVNLDAPFFITQSLLELIKKSSFKCVINMIDSMWDTPSVGFSHYALSKAGLWMMTKSLAKELAPYIRVNGISPGAILFQPFHTLDYQENTLKKIPQKRLGTPNELAQALLFLTEKAAYITGEILSVDGGRSI